ncbi:MAG: hypothetical protein LWW81_08930 [Rhodocyclales bacterium]|nr:hypothetical protein [Rhodocyclales bacterium]
MKLATLTAACLSLTLGACYIVPIDHRTPYQQPTAGGELPVTPALPTIYSARLYPLNDVAGKLGALTAQVSDGLNGRGNFSLTAGGEVLTGEASRVTNEHPGFGNVYRRVFGDGRIPSGGRRGIANAAGNRGSYISCEYVITSATNGTGACIFSNGAKYQLHFGA